MTPTRIALASIHVRGYRSCKNTEACFESDLTALIGRNGAGKSNLMLALRLVNLASRRYLEVKDHSIKQRISIELTFRIGKKSVKYRCYLLVQPTVDSGERVTKIDELWSFSDFKLKEPWVRIEHLVRNAIRRSRLMGSTPILQSELFATSDKGKKRIKLSASVRRAYYDLLRFIEEITYYSASKFTNPAACPTSFELDEKGNLAQNYSSGANHQQFLYDLYLSRRENIDQYKEFIDIVGEKGLGLIKKIGWKENKFSTTASEVQSGGKIIQRERVRRLVIPTVTVKGDELSFNQLSEGTFRTLALVFYVMTGGNDLLLIEEPEVCIHHGLLHDVVSILKEYSKSRQIILSTHAESVVDMLEPNNLRLVRDTSKGTVVRSISQQMSAIDLRALQKYLHSTGSLGEYWKHSGFDQ